eukprot:846137-Prorocentrum_lima.AAC.1
MTSSLVGSEMCIRDRSKTGHLRMNPREGTKREWRWEPTRGLGQGIGAVNCLLYTSDAADDM